MHREPSDIANTSPVNAPRSVFQYLKTVLVTLVVALFIKSFVVEAFRIPSGSMENTLLVGDFLVVNKLAYGWFSDVRRGDVVVFEYPGRRPVAGEGEGNNYIKRCIGLPGDTLEIRQSRVFIGGRELLFSRNVKIGDNAGYNASRRGITVTPAGMGYTEDNYGPVIVPKRGDVIELSPDNFERVRTFIEREGHTVFIDTPGKILVDGRSSDTYVVEKNYYFMLGDNRNNSLDSRFWGFVPEENLLGEALFIYWSWDPEISMTDLFKKVASIRWERMGMLVK